jgi:hypothetical protein
MNLPFQIEITQDMVIAFFFILLAAWIRRRSLEGKGNWNKAWDPVAPSLAANSPSMVGASRGVTGCTTWIVGWVLFLLFVAIFWDFLLFQGRATAYVWAQLPEWLAGLRDALIGLLRSMARLVL